MNVNSSSVPYPSESIAYLWGFSILLDQKTGVLLQPVWLDFLPVPALPPWVLFEPGGQGALEFSSFVNRNKIVGQIWPAVCYVWSSYCVGF